ncbi:unnamed protein product [Mytilus edulis]|uniref:Uncharacterized protein n=1 Tax=Mytilus edulis TaxID=6550 RepID=A0A8S3U5N0_MYTED|nr:unnamed protein product [Mytilus edulis]
MDKNCPPDDTKKWLGGKHYDLLCIDDISKNNLKYEMKSNGGDFELIIKTLNFSDLNCEYTCACGFNQYTDILKLDDDEIRQLYVTTRTRLKEEDGKFQINVSMEVYPLPACTIVLQDDVLPINLSVVKRLESDPKIFEVVVQTSIEIDMAFCGENLTIDCDVGSIHYKHVLKTPNSCKEMVRNDDVKIKLSMLKKNNAAEQRDICSVNETVVNEPHNCNEIVNMLICQEKNNSTITCIKKYVDIEEGLHAIQKQVAYQLESEV